MDFLGLRNLSVIERDPRPDRGQHGRAPRHRQHRRSMTRPSTRCCSRATSIGIFQLEGSAMRALMRSLAPDSFDDVAALIALYRPGPMAANMHYDYADRKNGRKPISYVHPDMAEVLADTQGLMIYQESMMRVAQKFAGYSLEDADNLRKAAGKKVRDIMAKEREKFVAGCERTGYGRRAGLGAVRRHRAVRRLRLQQEPQLRLRPHQLPDGLAQGQPPRRVPRRPAHQRQGRQGQDRGLPVRVPADGPRGPGARHQPVGLPLPRPSAEAGPRARGPSPSACRPSATSARASSSGSSPSGRRAAPSATSTTSASGSTRRPQQAHGRITDQGGGLRLPRPSPPGPVPGLRADRGADPGPSARARTGRHEPLRGPRRRRPRPSSTTPGSRSPTSSSTRPSGWPSKRRCSACT